MSKQDDPQRGLRSRNSGISLFRVEPLKVTPLISTAPQRERALEDILVILVVEDDQLAQGVVEEALSDGGFEVAIASTGEQALDLLDGSGAKYRALVTDIN